VKRRPGPLSLPEKRYQSLPREWTQHQKAQTVKRQTRRARRRIA
jgi:hypothetical protein